MSAYFDHEDRKMLRETHDSVVRLEQIVQALPGLEKRVSKIEVGCAVRHSSDTGAKTERDRFEQKFWQALAVLPPLLLILIELLKYKG